jgi:hypothetical protein
MVLEVQRREGRLSRRTSHNKMNEMAAVRKAISERAAPPNGGHRPHGPPSEVELIKAIAAPPIARQRGFKWSVGDGSLSEDHHAS